MAYKNIARGVSLAADHAKYITWLGLDTAGRQTAYAALDSHKKIRSVHEIGTIVPFSSSQSALIYIPAHILSSSQTGATNSELAQAVYGITSDYTFTETEMEALTGANILSAAKKFKFAKLTITERVTTATEKSASRIIGRQYYRHVTNSVTSHFGKKLVTQTYAGVVALIEASAPFIALTTGTNSKNRYRFVPEPN